MADGKNLGPVVVVGAVGALGLGLYLYSRKEPVAVVVPGDVIRAHFTFDYLGNGGDYVLLVRFGHHYPEFFEPETGFNHYTLPITLPGPDTQEFDVNCIIPDGTPAKTYDAEGSILRPEMEPGADWIRRVFKDKALTVGEG